MAVTGALSLTVCSLLTVFSAWQILAESQKAPYTKLVFDLFKFYDKRIAPGELNEADKNVTVGMSLISMDHLDVAYRIHVIESIIWIAYQYRDSRLVWNPSYYGNITVLRLPGSQIWTPDIEFYNAIDRPTFLSMTEYKSVVYHNGAVSFIPGVKVKSRCNPGIDTYNEIICSWKLGSWAYEGAIVDVWNDGDTIGGKDFDSLNWNITSTKLWREAKTYLSCPGTYPAIFGKATLNKKLM